MIAELDDIKVTCWNCGEPQEIVANGTVPGGTLVRCSACRGILGDWSVIKLAATSAANPAR